MAAAVISAILQFSAIFPAWYETSSVQPIAALGGVNYLRGGKRRGGQGVVMKWQVYLLTMRIVIPRPPSAKWRDEFGASSKNKKEICNKVLTNDSGETILARGERNPDLLTDEELDIYVYCREFVGVDSASRASRGESQIVKLMKAAEGDKFDANKDRSCEDNTADCYDIDLRTWTNIMTNQGFQQFSAILPDFVGSRQSGPALFWGGIFTLIFCIFITIVLVMGAGYLYYYSEVKSTGNARKGALAAFVAAPFLAMIIALIGMFILVFTQPQNTSPIMMLVTVRSQCLPSPGYWISISNLVIMSVCLCFSKFWRIRRAEKVRKQRKQEEEEEEFMRMMGIDPNGPQYSESESDSSSSSESESEDEDRETLLTGQPHIVYSNAPQPTVQRYVVQTAPVQQQVQTQPRVVGNKIYL